MNIVTAIIIVIGAVIIFHFLLSNAAYDHEGE